MKPETKAKRMLERGEKPKDMRTKLGRIWKSLKDQNVGDAIKEVTDAMGIEQCDECKQRQHDWNFGDRKEEEKAKELKDKWKISVYRPLNDSEYTEIGEILKRSNRSVLRADQKALARIFKDVMGGKWKQSNCGKCVKGFLERMEALYLVHKYDLYESS